MSTTRVLPSETPRNQACGETVFLLCGAEGEAARKRTKPHTKKTQASAALEKMTTDRLYIRRASCKECGRGDALYFELNIVISEADLSSAAADSG
jgi:hypothetical protein